MRKLLLPLLLLPRLLFAEVVEADLLIVGGNESACAAAVQAARLGVRKILLVNDIDWLGGQFSAEGVGCPDEWTVVNGTKTNFPRSGLFLEVIRRIRAHNSSTYGVPCPGNAFCGTETIEPAAAAAECRQNGGEGGNPRDEVGCGGRERRRIKGHNERIEFQEV
jgi:hypothetical protein